MALSRPGAGAVLFVAAGACFVGMDVMAKLLATRVHPVQALWARYAVQMVLAVALVLPRLSTVVRSRHPGIQTARSLFLFGATTFFFVGYQVNSVALTVALANTAPVLVGLGAALFLGERFGLHRAAATAMGLVGALIIIRPFSESFTPWAILPLLGACSYSAYALTTRLIGEDEDNWTSFFYSGLAATIALTLALPFAWEPLETSDLPLLLAVGLFGGIGQLLLIRALSLGEAGFLAPFMYAQVVFAVIAQLLVFETLPDRLTLLGALVIVGAGLYVLHRQRLNEADVRRTLPPDP